MNKKTYAIIGLLMLFVGLSIMGCKKDSTDPPAPSPGTEKDFYISDDVYSISKKQSGAK